MNIINLKLFKNTSDDRELFILTPSNEQILNTLLGKHREANAAKATKKDAIDAMDALARQTVAALLDAPNGLTRGELLMASDCESIISITQKIRNYLKKDNIYTLKKYKKGSVVTYRLEKL